MRQKLNISMLLLLLTLFTGFYACSDDEETETTEIMAEIPKSMILSNDGDNNTVNLNLSEHTVWRVEVRGEEAGWCDVVPASGTGPGRFIVTGQPNVDRKVRSAELLVTVGRDTRSLTVSQKDTIGISVKGTNTPGNAGDTLFVAIEANTSWVVTPSDPVATWVTFSPDHGKGKGEVRVVVEANLFQDSRSTEITFSAGSARYSMALSQQNILPGRASDSLTLVALYNSADGPYWSSAWDLEKEITTWNGVSTALVGDELRVTALELSYSNLDGTFPAMIGNLSALEKLDLSSNALGGKLPEGMGLLTKLRTLNLSRNNLEGDIPQTMRYLTELEELNAQDNRFTAFPIEILQLPKLRIVRLNKNGLVSLPGELVAQGGLEELYLNDNRIESFPAGILQSGKLKTVHLENNQIVSFSGKITATGGLKELYLNDNQMTAFPGGLELLTGLTKLNVANNKLSAISESVTSLTALQELYLNGNRFSGAFPEGMENMVALKIINATDCGIPGRMPEWGKDGKLVKLTEIHLGGNRLTGQLTEDLGHVTNLKYLVLDDNLLDGELPAGALDNTKQLKALKRFCIARNNLSGEIPAILAKRISGYSYVLDADGFRLNGNRLKGPVPVEFKSANAKYNIAENLYPQQGGTIEQAQ